MRKQVEEYLLGLGWEPILSGWTDKHLYVFTLGNLHWCLKRWGGGIGSPILDDGESLGELKLALAGLEAQATQGAI